MNALLELSRIDRTELEYYELNILKMIANCIKLFDRESNVDFHFKADIVNENCITLGVKMRKVIMSVLDNAVRFHQEENRKVFIDILENDIDYIIKISDNGPGIPEKAIHKIFTIFYTVNSKDIEDTTGAGLAISCKIMKLVGGKIEYSPHGDNGSVFTIHWPKIITLKN